MTATALPHIAARLDRCSGTWYAAEHTQQITGNDEHLIVWMPRPVMTDGDAQRYRWAEDDSRIGTRHITLGSITLAMLLYLADGEPLGLTDEDALAAIDRALTEVRCDMLRCSARVSGDFDGRRWRCCEQRAARLCGTEA